MFRVKVSVKVRIRVSFRVSICSQVRLGLRLRLELGLCRLSKVKMQRPSGPANTHRRCSLRDP